METPASLRTPLSSKDSVAALVSLHIFSVLIQTKNSWGEAMLGVTNETETDHFKMVVQNLLIDESRIQFKSRVLIFLVLVSFTPALPHKPSKLCS